MNSSLFRAKMVLEGYTQKSLAKEAGMAENTLGGKINNKVSCTTDDVKKFCRILHISDPADKCAIFLD